MNKLAAVALLSIAALPMNAQTKVLVAKHRVPSSVTFEGFRSFALPTACDEQGRSYVKLNKPDLVQDGPLLRLSAKGVLEAEFDTTDALANIYGVRPDGGVVMLHLDGTTKVVDNFSPDGKRKSSVRLEASSTAFFPLQIAVFRSGEMLIGGLQYRFGYKASTVIYDANGHLVKQVVLDSDAEIERAIEVGDSRYTRAPRGGNEPVSRSVAITGDDGFVYLVRATSPAAVYVISRTGEVVRKIMVKAPTDTGSPAFGIRVVKNKLALKFYRGCDGFNCEGAAYAMIDATTGETLADYIAEEGADGPIACYVPDPDRFFTFWISPDQHRLEIVEAGPK